MTRPRRDPPVVTQRRLSFRAPYDAGGLLGFLAMRAVPGVEEGDRSCYRRTLDLPHGAGVAELRPTADHVACRLRLEDPRDEATAVDRCRRLLDLDADPVAVDAVLVGDPLLAPLVARNPGRRVPGHVDGSELAIRAVLGQQVSVAAARTLAGRLAEQLGATLPFDDPTLRRLFPSAEAIASMDPSELVGPMARRRALQEVAGLLATGEVTLDPRADGSAAADRLLAVPGVGPWTVGYIAMRALGDADAFLPSDLVIRRVMAAAGCDDSIAAVTARAERWRPWRAYALQHLWAASASPQADRIVP